MSDDIVKRLRRNAEYVDTLANGLCNAAADEIERLRALLKAFEEARRIAQYLRENAKPAPSGQMDPATLEQCAKVVDGLYTEVLMVGGEEDPDLKAAFELAAKRIRALGETGDD